MTNQATDEDYSEEKVYHDRYPVQVGSQHVQLPLVPVTADLAIALIMSIDMPLSFIDQAGVELAALLRPYQPAVVVTAATLGIPVAWATAKALGLDTVIVLQKTNKIHLADALVEPLTSITTSGTQVLRLDRARIPELAGGTKTAFVDDVISTGGSAAAALRLIAAAGGRVCCSGTLLTEGTAYRTKLGAAAADTLVSLGSIPVFRPAADQGGGWVAVVD
jgi:adenine/guanine phosphoribosyltransferase-like PRPP-binding protein